MGFKQFNTAILGAALLVSSSAYAGNVSLSPVGNVGLGNFTVDLSIDSFSPATVGGFVDISWNSSVISFVSYSVNSPWTDMGYTGLDNVTGSINSLWFDTATPQTDGLVMTLTFSADNYGFSNINISDDQPSGSFTDGAPLGNPIATNFNGTSVTVVPVPAAVWLFGSGLLGLVGVARRRQ